MRKMGIVDLLLDVGKDTDSNLSHEQQKDTDPVEVDHAGISLAESTAP